MKTEEILEKFKKHLEEKCIVLPEEYNSIDLYTFFKALTELKTVTKLNTRQVQASLKAFKEAFSLVEDQIKKQEAMRQTIEAHHKKEIVTIQTDHVIELIHYRDRLQRNINESEQLCYNLTKNWFCFRLKKKARGLLEGLKLGINHIDYKLNKKGVERIETLGSFFNPKFMKISMIESHKGIKNLMVLAEVVSGYLGEGGQIIRYAEVIVNKK